MALFASWEMFGKLKDAGCHVVRFETPDASICVCVDGGAHSSPQYPSWIWGIETEKREWKGLGRERERKVKEKKGREREKRYF